MKPLGLVDTLQLRRLVDLYAHAADRGDVEGFTALFAEDGILESARGRFVGKDEIAAAPRYLAERYQGTFHAVLNHLTWTEEGSVHGETYCLARHFLDGKDGPACYEMTIRYEDIFTVRNAEWVFRHRRLIVDATRTFPLSTLTVTPDQAAEDTKSRALPER